MNGSEKPKGQVLDIAGMLDIAQQYHDAKQAPAATKTKTEVSVANLGFTQPATLAEINDVAVRLGYDPFPERMLANNGDRVFLPTQVFVLFK